MEKPEILHYPNPRLRRIAKPISTITRELLERIELLFEVMAEDRGIGLAAPQVGWDVRLFVMNLTGLPEDRVVLINPVITERKGLVTAEEGCLSLPGVYAKVERPKEVVVEARMLNGEELDGAAIRIASSGLNARCIQHELDHLDGVLFIDKVTPLRQRAIKRKLKELEDAFREQAELGTAPRLAAPNNSVAV